MGLNLNKASDILSATVKHPGSATGPITVDLYGDVPNETGLRVQIRGGNAGVGYSDDSLFAPQSALKSGDAFRSWLRSNLAERHLKGTSEVSTESKQTAKETTAQASQKVKEVVDKTGRQVGPGADIDIVGDGQAGSVSGAEVAVTSEGSNRGNLAVIALLLGGAALFWGWLYD